MAGVPAHEPSRILVFPLRAKPGMEKKKNPVTFFHQEPGRKIINLLPPNRKGIPAGVSRGPGRSLPVISLSECALCFVENVELKTRIPTGSAGAAGNR
jgi:hypothetical protein